MYNWFLVSFQTFPQELSVFLREHHNGMYRSDVYFLCKTTAEVRMNKDSKGKRDKDYIRDF